MEHKVSTIVALTIFAGLFIVAVIFVQLDSDNDGSGDQAANKNLPKVVGRVPDPQPDKIDADAETEWTELPSGLKYRILRKSDGPRPTHDDAVAVAYKGWTQGGKVFDSSYGKEEPYFALNPPWPVIKGWKEGIPYLAEGGMMELEIPSELGYGEQGAGDSIDPGATLWFRVEVLKIFSSKE